MKIVKKITSLILSVFLISGCQQNQEFNRDIYAMDTYINVSIYANNDSLLEEVENKIYELENLLSITKTSSDIYKINNRTTSNVTVDMETAGRRGAAYRPYRADCLLRQRRSRCRRCRTNQRTKRQIR